MKHNKFYNILALLSLLLIGAACTNKEDIVFDHEKPQFETREGAYLLEVIMPQGTLPEDEIYIIGPFNGGDSAAVVNDQRWKLEKCQNNNIKWGIYLFPDDFTNGATLADGYTFVNLEQGMERSLTGTPVTHTEVPALGGRINVTVDRWQAYFDTPADPGEIVHDGYAIFVNDQTTWGDLAMYAWGDGLPELFGGWPGIKPTGTVEVGKVKYKYFDTGDANKGLTYNIIFNNNNNGIQIDGPAITLDRDYYFTITDDGWQEESDGPAVTHDGYAIFIMGSTGWDEVAMYAWGDGLPELYGGWPGISATGTQKINGVEYSYWDTGDANKGLLYNFILNNNNNGKQFDLCSVTLDRDYYFMVDGTHGEEIDPQNPPVVGPVDPNPDPVTHPYTIYVDNKLAWSENALYAWGDKEMFGGWPGLVCTETKDVAGVKYLVFPYEGAGETLTLILNNNNQGQQVDGPAITADRDYYFMIDENGWTEVSPATPTYRLYIDDQTGWDAIAVYAWGDVEMFGGWPGAQPEATENIDGVDYKVVVYEGNGENLNLIFNNNGGGVQTPDLPIVADKDYFITVTATDATIK